MNSSWRGCLAVGILVAGAVAGAEEPLLCYVGGTMRPAMEDIVKAYESRSRRQVLLDFADSGQLMIKAKQTRKGDLYIGHDPFFTQIMREGMGVRGWSVGSLTPVIVVQKGNPKGIRSLKDLGKPGLRLVLTHSTYSTMGWLYPRMAEKAGIGDALMSNRVAETKGGSEAANAVGLKAADASIVWDVVAALRRDSLDIIPIEPEYAMASGVDTLTSATFGRQNLGHIKVTLITLKYSTDLKAATDFAEFAAGPAAAAIWTRHGFGPPFPVPPFIRDGRSCLSGSILVYCAAGMRAPVEALAGSFEREAGVKVEITYDGSNKLLGQIKLARRGDVYLAGDADYIDMAARENLLKGARATICFFEPVIMVHKGNPKKISALGDLVRSGIRVGQVDPKTAAMGRLLPRLLDLHGVDPAAWERNVLLNVPTITELGAAVKLGSIDAAVVWRSVADDYSAEADIIEIPRDKNLIPAVEGAVLADSKNPAAAEAFLSYLTSDRGRFQLINDGYAVDRP